jgi:hypothetical protein
MKDPQHSNVPYSLFVDRASEVRFRSGAALHLQKQIYCFEGVRGYRKNISFGSEKSRMQKIFFRVIFRIHQTRTAIVNGMRFSSEKLSKDNVNCHSQSMRGA